MPNNWKTYKLGEVATLQRGFDLPNTKRTDGKYPVIAASGFSTWHNEFKVKAPGVTTGRSGTLGQVHYVKSDFWPLNTSLWVKDFNGNDERFIYYFLQTLNFEEYNSGTSVPTLNRNDVHKLDVTIPDFQEQQSIASILSAIDDKIENNLAINKTLEEMAMALYKHWFVDFGPFQDGEFVESEIFGINNTINIPTTFSVLYVKNEIERLKSINKYTQENVEKLGKIRVFDQSNTRILGFHNNLPDFLANFNNPMLIFGDHTCRMELICEKFSVGPNLIPFKSKQKEYLYLMYLALKDKVKMNDYKRHWSELMLHQFVVPNDINILINFNNSVRDYFNLINKNKKKTKA